MRFPRIHNELSEESRRGLVDRPFRVRAESGSLLEARAFGYKNQVPQVEVGNRRVFGFTWQEVQAAVERGGIPHIRKALTRRTR